MKKYDLLIVSNKEKLFEVTGENILDQLDAIVRECLCNDMLMMNEMGYSDGVAENCYKAYISAEFWMRLKDYVAFISVKIYPRDCHPYQDEVGTINNLRLFVKPLQFCEKSSEEKP